MFAFKVLLLSQWWNPNKHSGLEAQRRAGSVLHDGSMWGMA